MSAPLRVDRVFKDRETFEWAGVHFQMHDLPGQTDLHSGISFEMDGQRYLAVGDSVHIRAGKLAHGDIIFANRVCGMNHLKVGRRLLEVEPDVLLNGHHRRELDRPQPRGDVPVNRQDLEDFLASAERLAGVLDELVADSVDRRCRADWVRFEPYRIGLQAGEASQVECIVENLEAGPIEVVLRFVPPDGVTVEPPTATARIAPTGEHRSMHTIRCDRNQLRFSPRILCVDVTLNGKPLGWVAECQLWSEGVEL